MTLPILYSFRRCPYAIRARLALKAANVTVELREIALRHKPAEMLTASAKGTVPVLILPEGLVLEQSLDIMAWALRQHDPEGWLPPSLDDAAATSAIISANDGPFKVLLDGYKYAERHPQPSEVYRAQAIDVHLAPLNQRLVSAPYLLGQTPTLADMAIVPFVRQFSQVDAAWFDTSALPALRAWLARLTSTDLFNAVMVKQPVWAPGQPGNEF